MRISFLVTFVGLTLTTAGVQAIAPKLSGGQIAQIEKGKVIVRTMKPKGGDGVSAQAFGLIDAPPAKVWPVIRDCQHFARFMPRTKVSKLLERNGNKSKCKIEISMPFPISNLWSVVQSTETELADGSFKRKWSLLKGTYKKNDGSWSLYPYGEGGQKTLLVYFLDVDPKIMVPDAIIRRAQAGTLPDLFKAVAKRVKLMH